MLWKLQPATPCHKAMGFVAPLCPAQLLAESSSAAHRSSAFPRDLGSSCLCLSPGLKQAGKAPLKFAACVFLGLEITSKVYRRKVVSTSLLSQAQAEPWTLVAALSKACALSPAWKGLLQAAQGQLFQTFRVTTALQGGLASWEFSNISQIIFFLHSNSQCTSPLMHSTPHAAKQAPGWEFGQSHDRSSFGPDSKCSLCYSHLSAPHSPDLTEPKLHMLLIFLLLIFLSLACTNSF